MKKFQDRLTLSRQKLELFYSIFLLLVIPGLIVVNTILVNRSVRTNFDAELRRKADLANTLFGSSIKTSIENPSAVQASLDNIVSQTDDVSEIVVAIPSGTQFDIVASQQESIRGTTISSLQFQLAADRQQSVAQKVNRSSDTAANQSWNVVTPIFGDQEGELVALTSMDVSVAEAEEAISSSLQRSFIILAVTVLIVALLLANHFRFVEYAQLFQKLKEADQLKIDFLSVATHELKAPMAIIKGQISNITDGIFGEVNADVKKHLNETVGQTDRLNHLVTDLLNVSRIEQGRIKFEVAVFDPSKIIETLVEQYKEKASRKNITINYQKPNQINIKADENRFQEIMTNLIDNAVKYSLEGEITIRHEVTDNKVITRVKDKGIGMSAEEKARLFNRFYRARNEKTADIGGTGLGLWIIKQYTEQMGGKIFVDSLEGEGSEFFVELPRS